MNAGETRMWQQVRDGWWQSPQLMELRDAWMEQHVAMVEDIVTTFPNGYVSRHEWRATVAEAAFDNSSYRRSEFPAGPDSYWAVHQMRQTWAEEAMLFFTIGQPLDDGFDVAEHGDNMLRHEEERVHWRPHHRLPGPPDRLYEPVPPEGLTKDWWHDRPMQELRRRCVTTLLAQNDALAQIFADDPLLQPVSGGRDWLVGKQRFGWPFRRRDERVVVPEAQDHFERGVFAMMRGYIGEVQHFTQYGLPIGRDYDPADLFAVCEARKMPPYHTPYLTKGSPLW